MTGATVRARSLPIDRPASRRLRAYAFDPSLSTELENAVINNMVLQVPWEIDPEDGSDGLHPGPVGEYLEVIDFDPASGCFYAPINLNDPHLLAQDGLQPSIGNPQFHQQMVYAVAMATIRNFERALGRAAMWAPRRPSEEERGRGDYGKEQYVQRLRIYPHALREANAYYSPQKRALLFGYFPASYADAHYHLPGGTVFTCLSQDIIAHETTHALLHGLHPRFNEASNPDMLAFHEAFADIVALFQHFTFAEVLRHQIAKTRGDLASENLLGQLAQEFGRATGSHGALRDALGQEKNGRWEPTQPDPTAIDRVFEPHARGSLLVAAVFEAFVSIYKTRVADLMRIATSGTGVLPEGQLHPDLVNRLASEAAKSAQHVLNMCIRALDYCPPVDLTFGDYLRALITADYDAVPNDDLGYRVAITEAFRRRGIVPRDVRSLSIDSLRWPEPSGQSFQPNFIQVVPQSGGVARRWSLTSNRAEVFDELRESRRALHSWLKGDLQQVAEVLLGLDLKPDQRGEARFEVHSMRPARRIGPDGVTSMDMVIEITQWRPGFFGPDPTLPSAGGGLAVTPHPDEGFVFRGGCSLLVDIETARVRYAIVKDIKDTGRLERQRAFLRGDTDTSLRATYFRAIDREQGEPFAFLHRIAD
ncbi:MAG: hypothetical protein CYG59_00765 [Chloroflexi bacterium]|nr:MAG: hypothetical protein CYG59_00765 [Chloroflexota bacterium]